MKIEKVDDFRWRIPRSARPGMLTDAVIYASSSLLEAIRRDQSLEQVINVAMLPGIVGPSLAMPDIHQGYGFPIGGVAAMDAETGVVSPGGVGFDINCGVRLLGSPLTAAEVAPRLKDLVDQLFRDVPSGTGMAGPLKLSDADIAEVLEQGSEWTVRRGFGSEDDLAHTEERGAMSGASAAEVSVKAKQRGKPQLGTLGSGNHFLEVQYVDTVFDSDVAQELGLEAGGIVVLIHTGSRGLGHQVCTDYVARMQDAMRRYGIQIPDRQLACTPIASAEGQSYMKAMAAAANFAWANRQYISHRARSAFQRVFGRDLRMPVIYDVAHNIAKMETHEVNGKPKRLLVHRKGATRAFPGQPVIIPGSMGTASYVLVGQQESMRQTFGSACHGAGRLLSRSAAKKGANAKEIQKDLESRGTMVRALTREGITEEKPEAYKDVDAVVDVIHNVGIAAKVVRLRPIGVIKG